MKTTVTNLEEIQDQIFKNFTKYEDQHLVKITTHKAELFFGLNPQDDADKITLSNVTLYNVRGKNLTNQIIETAYIQTENWMNIYHGTYESRSSLMIDTEKGYITVDFKAESYKGYPEVILRTSKTNNE